MTRPDEYRVTYNMPRTTYLLWRNIMLLCAVISQVSYAIAAIRAEKAQPSVTISQGILLGTTTSLNAATAAVTKYIGIPFAQSPPERFAPPRAASSWRIPLHAVTTMPACLQQNLGPQAGEDLEVGQSEDCLYMNIYLPPDTTEGCNKPVMVWFYGGNLQSGSTGYNIFDGSSFAYNQDVIIVTFNYRMNIFGFSNSPELPLKDRNAGFHDQRFALKWIRHNIGKFGGDKDKVTIFGQSAGAYSVKQLLALPPSPRPYRAAIMQSQALGLYGNGSTNWLQVATLVGCANASSVMRCMRQANATVIQDYVQTNSITFPPTIDGVTRLSDTTPAFQNSTAARVPILLGTNTQEARLIASQYGLDTPSAPSLDAFSYALFPGDAGAPLRQIFTSLAPTNTSTYLAVSEVLTNLVYQCPASRLANVTQDAGSKVWRYLYGAFAPGEQWFPDAGVYHGSEMPQVFGTYEVLGNTTAQQVQLSEYMQTAWAKFAKNPSGGPGWPSLGEAQSIGLLGVNGSHGEHTARGSIVDAICSCYELLDTYLGFYT